MLRQLIRTDQQNRMLDRAQAFNRPVQAGPKRRPQRRCMLGRAVQQRTKMFFLGIGKTLGLHQVSRDQRRITRVHLPLIQALHREFA